MFYGKALFGCFGLWWEKTLSNGEKVIVNCEAIMDAL